MHGHRSPNRSPESGRPEPAPAGTGARFQHLLDLMAELRDPVRGCPWTKAQTFETILPYTIEEVYEVVDAVRAGDMEHLCDELGDLLLQVIYHARIAEETGAFGADDVVAALTDKLVRRHPHVFEADETVDSDTVMRNWERIKENEPILRTHGRSVLGRVPRSGPALVRARKLQDAVARATKEVDSPGPAAEARRALEHSQTLTPDSAEAYRVIGDAMFALVRLARARSVDPETALDGANTRFQQRVATLEQSLRDDGRHLRDAAPEERAMLWLGR